MDTEIETRASRCAKLSQDFYDMDRADEIMKKCEQVAKERGHRSLILAGKDNNEYIINILRENGFIIKNKTDKDIMTTYINW